MCFKIKQTLFPEKLCPIVFFIIFIPRKSWILHPEQQWAGVEPHQREFEQHCVWWQSALYLIEPQRLSFLGGPHFQETTVPIKSFRKFCFIYHNGVFANALPVLAVLVVLLVVVVTFSIGILVVLIVVKALVFVFVGVGGFVNTVVVDWVVFNWVDVVPSINIYLTLTSFFVRYINTFEQQNSATSVGFNTNCNTVVRALSGHDHFSKPLWLTQFRPDNHTCLPRITIHARITIHKLF